MALESAMATNWGNLAAELQMQIIQEAVHADEISGVLRYRLVSSKFNHLVTEAVYDSDIVVHMATNPMLHRDREFWPKYLAYRVLGDKKPPSFEHILLRKVAEKVCEWRRDEGRHDVAAAPDGDSQLEHVVAQICRMAVCFGKFYLRRNVYLGCPDSWCLNHIARRAELPKDWESSGWFAEATITTATYLNEPCLLEHLFDCIEKKRPTYGGILPPEVEHKEDDEGEDDEDEDDEDDDTTKDLQWGAKIWAHRIPLSIPPQYEGMDYGDRKTDFSTVSRYSLHPRLWLGSPVAVGLHLRHDDCLAVLLRRFRPYPAPQLMVRCEVLEAGLLAGDADLMDLAGPNMDPAPSIEMKTPESRRYRWRTLWHTPRVTKYPNEAVERLVGTLETTCNPETFDRLHPLLRRVDFDDYLMRWSVRGGGGGKDAEDEEDDDDDDCSMQKWGSARLARASHDGALPIVKRLLLGFGPGPNDRYRLSGAQPLVGAIEGGHDDVVELLLGHTNRLDGGLAAAARTGNEKVARWLIGRGATRNKESMRTALSGAMLAGRDDMVALLVRTGKTKGVMNKKAKLALARELKAKDMERMMGLLKIL